MKNILFTLALLISFSSFGQENIENNGYVIITKKSYFSVIDNEQSEKLQLKIYKDSVASEILGYHYPSGLTKSSDEIFLAELNKMPVTDRIILLEKVYDFKKIIVKAIKSIRSDEYEEALSILSDLNIQMVVFKGIYDFTYYPFESSIYYWRAVVFEKKGREFASASSNYYQLTLSIEKDRKVKPALLH